MANLKSKIESHLGKSVNFQTEVILQDDGSGAYIKEWNLSDTKPTDEQLKSAETSADTAEKLLTVKETRRISYGSWQSQLDMLYADMLAGKVDTTGAWATHIKAVKDANPKP